MPIYTDENLPKQESWQLPQTQVYQPTLRDQIIAAYNTPNRMPTASNEFSRGLTSTSLNLQASEARQRQLEALRAKNYALADEYKRQADDLEQQAYVNAPINQNFTDALESPSRLPGWAMGALGSMVPTVLPTLASGAAGAFGAGRLAKKFGLDQAKAQALGGWAGGTIPAYQMERNEAISEAMANPEIMANRSLDEIANAAMVKGGLAAGMEALVPAAAGGFMRGASKVLPRGVNRLAKGEVLPAAGTEFLTEGAQSLIGQSTQNYLEGKSLTDYDWTQALNEAAAGAVGGAGMAAPGALGRAGYNWAQRNKENIADKAQALGQTITNTVTGNATQQDAQNAQEFANEVKQEVAVNEAASETTPANTQPAQEPPQAEMPARNIEPGNIPSVDKLVQGQTDEQVTPTSVEPTMNVAAEEQVTPSSVEQSAGVAAEEQITPTNYTEEVISSLYKNRQAGIGIKKTIAAIKPKYKGQTSLGKNKVDAYKAIAGKFKNLNSMHKSVSIVSNFAEALETFGEDFANNVLNGRDLKEAIQISKARGLKYGDKVILFTDNNIDDNQLFGTFLHEVGVHKGLRTVFTDQDFQTTVNQIEKWALTVGDIELQELASRAINNVRDNPVYLQQSFEKQQEEIVANFISEAIDAGYTPSFVKDAGDNTRLNKKLVALLDSIFDKIKKLLISIKLKPESFTAQELVDLVWGMAGKTVNNQLGEFTNNEQQQTAKEETNERVEEEQKARIESAKEILADLDNTIAIHQLENLDNDFIDMSGVFDNIVEDENAWLNIDNKKLENAKQVIETLAKNPEYLSDSVNAILQREITGEGLQDGQTPFDYFRIAEEIRALPENEKSVIRAYWFDEFVNKNFNTASQEARDTVSFSLPINDNFVIPFYKKFISELVRTHDSIRNVETGAQVNFSENVFDSVIDSGYTEDGKSFIEQDERTIDRNLTEIIGQKSQNFLGFIRLLSQDFPKSNKNAQAAIANAHVALVDSFGPRALPILENLKNFIENLAAGEYTKDVASDRLLHIIFGGDTVVDPNSDKLYGQEKRIELKKLEFLKTVILKVRNEVEDIEDLHFKVVLEEALQEKAKAVWNDLKNKVENASTNEERIEFQRRLNDLERKFYTALNEYYKIQLPSNKKQDALIERVNNVLQNNLDWVQDYLNKAQIEGLENVFVKSEITGKWEFRNNKLEDATAFKDLLDKIFSKIKEFRANLGFVKFIKKAGVKVRKLGNRIEYFVGGKWTSNENDPALEEIGLLARTNPVLNEHFNYPYTKLWSSHRVKDLRKNGKEKTISIVIPSATERKAKGDPDFILSKENIKRLATIRRQINGDTRKSNLQKELERRDEVIKKFNTYFINLPVLSQRAVLKVQRGANLPSFISDIEADRAQHLGYSQKELQGRILNVQRVFDEAVLNALKHFGVKGKSRKLADEKTLLSENFQLGLKRFRVDLEKEIAKLKIKEAREQKTGELSHTDWKEWNEDAYHKENATLSPDEQVLMRTGSEHITIVRDKRKFDVLTDLYALSGFLSDKNVFKLNEKGEEEHFLPNHLVLQHNWVTRHKLANAGFRNLRQVEKDLLGNEILPRLQNDGYCLDTVDLVTASLLEVVEHDGISIEQVINDPYKLGKALTQYAPYWALRKINDIQDPDIKANLKNLFAEAFMVKGLSREDRELAEKTNADAYAVALMQINKNRGSFFFTVRTDIKGVIAPEALEAALLINYYMALDKNQSYGYVVISTDDRVGRGNFNWRSIVQPVPFRTDFINRFLGKTGQLQSIYGEKNQEEVKQELLRDADKVIIFHGLDRPVGRNQGLGIVRQQIDEEGNFIRDEKGNFREYVPNVTSKGKIGISINSLIDMVSKDQQNEEQSLLKKLGSAIAAFYDMDAPRDHFPTSKAFFRENLSTTKQGIYPGYSMIITEEMFQNRNAEFKDVELWLNGEPEEFDDKTYAVIYSEDAAGNKILRGIKGGKESKEYLFNEPPTDDETARVVKAFSSILPGDFYYGMIFPLDTKLRWTEDGYTTTYEEIISGHSYLKSLKEDFTYVKEHTKPALRYIQAVFDEYFTPKNGVPYATRGTFTFEMPLIENLKTAIENNYLYSNPNIDKKNFIEQDKAVQHANRIVDFLENGGIQNIFKQNVGLSIEQAGENILNFWKENIGDNGAENPLQYVKGQKIMANPALFMRDYFVTPFQESERRIYQNKPDSIDYLQKKLSFVYQNYYNKLYNKYIYEFDQENFILSYQNYYIDKIVKQNKTLSMDKDEEDLLYKEAKAAYDADINKKQRFKKEYQRYIKNKKNIKPLTFEEFIKSDEKNKYGNKIESGDKIFDSITAKKLIEEILLKNTIRKLNSFDITKVFSFGNLREDANGNFKIDFKIKDERWLDEYNTFLKLIVDKDLGLWNEIKEQHKAAGKNINSGNASEKENPHEQPNVGTLREKKNQEQREAEKQKVLDDYLATKEIPIFRHDIYYGALELYKAFRMDGKPDMTPVEAEGRYDWRSETGDRGEDILTMALRETNPYKYIEQNANQVQIQSFQNKDGDWYKWIDKKIADSENYRSIIPLSDHLDPEYDGRKENVSDYKSHRNSYFNYDLIKTYPDEKRLTFEDVQKSLKNENDFLSIYKTLAERNGRAAFLKEDIHPLYKGYNAVPRITDVTPPFDILQQYIYRNPEIKLKNMKGNFELNRRTGLYNKLRYGLKDKDIEKILKNNNLDFNEIKKFVIENTNAHRESYLKTMREYFDNPELYSYVPMAQEEITKETLNATKADENDLGIYAEQIRLSFKDEKEKELFEKGFSRIVQFARTGLNERGAPYSDRLAKNDLLRLYKRFNPEHSSLGYYEFFDKVEPLLYQKDFTKAEVEQAQLNLLEYLKSYISKAPDVEINIPDDNPISITINEAVNKFDEIIGGAPTIGGAYDQKTLNRLRGLYRKIAPTGDIKGEANFINAAKPLLQNEINNGENQVQALQDVQDIITQTVKKTGRKIEKEKTKELALNETKESLFGKERKTDKKTENKVLQDFKDALNNEDEVIFLAFKPDDPFSPAASASGSLKVAFQRIFSESDVNRKGESLAQYFANIMRGGDWDKTKREFVDTNVKFDSETHTAILQLDKELLKEIRAEFYDIKDQVQTTEIKARMDKAFDNMLTALAYMHKSYKDSNLEENKAQLSGLRTDIEQYVDKTLALGYDAADKEFTKSYTQRFDARHDLKKYDSYNNTRTRIINDINTYLHEYYNDPDKKETARNAIIAYFLSQETKPLLKEKQRSDFNAKFSDVFFDSVKPSKDAAQDAENYIRHVLGDEVTTNIFHAAKDFIGSFEEKDGKKIINLAMSGDILSTAHHEAMHAFMSTLKTTKPYLYDKMMKFSSRYKDEVVKVLKKYKADKAIESALNDPEELAAYTYQLSMAGLIPQNALTKKMVGKLGQMWLRVAGMFNNAIAQQARDNVDNLEAETKLAALYRRFNAGEYTHSRDTFWQALEQDFVTKQRNKTIAKTIEILGQWGDKLVNASDAVLRRANIPALTQLADLFYSDVVDRDMSENLKKGTTGDALLKYRQLRSKWRNSYNNIIKDLSDADKDKIRIAMLYKNPVEGRDTLKDERLKNAYNEIFNMFDKIYDDMIELGAHKRERIWGLRDNGKEGWLTRWVPITGKDKFNDFPYLWNQNAIRENRIEFTNLLTKEIEAAIKDGRFKSDLPSYDDKGNKIDYRERAWAEELVATMLGEKITAEDIENRYFWVQSNPFGQEAMREENLGFIRDRVQFEKFFEKSMDAVIAEFIIRGSKIAVFQNVFGVGKNNKITELLDTARVALAKEKKLDLIKDKAEIDKLMRPYERAVDSMCGILGNNISPQLRQINAMGVSYQNFRLLALSLFASFQDVVGLAIHGGSIKDQWEGFIRGLREIKNTWTKTESKDEYIKLAEAFGVVDPLSAVGSVAELEGTQHLTGKWAKLSQAFFRWNGLEGWTRGIKAQAFVIAERKIKHWAKEGLNAKNKYDALLFKRCFGDKDPLSIELEEDGSIKNTLENAAAVNRIVADMIMTPTEANRPVWANDPHYMLFAQLKTFSYTLHRVMLRGLGEQFRLGNVRPAGVALAGMVPVALTGYVIKEMILSMWDDDDDTDWKFEPKNLIPYSIDRSGLGGIPLMYMNDILNVDPIRMLGPTFDQIQNILSIPLRGWDPSWFPGKVAYTHTTKNELVSALPASTIIRTFPGMYDK